VRYKLIGLVISTLLLCQAPPLRAAEIQLGMSGGIYTVAVQINRSVALQFLVDPGAGTVVIPLSVLRQLVQNGSVTEGDVIGVGAAQLADSSLYLTARVRLRELRIGNAVVHDVTAAVSPGLSQPLLGQSFFRRFASVTFDNRRQVLILSDDAAVASPRYPASGGWGAPYSPYPATPPVGEQGYGYPGYGAGFER
jgi:hypothetical protein